MSQLAHTDHSVTGNGHVDASSVQAGAARRARIVLLLACTATFIAFLDVTVVNVAFPSLQHDFTHTPVTTLSWVISGYAVLFAALLTPAGRLADVIGRRSLFLGGVALFTAASAASALAPSVAFLIAARAVQGIAAAAMIPASLAMLLAAVPPARRMAAVGLWGASASIAAAAGPSLGGLLVHATNWRSVFVINIPIGLATLIAGRRSIVEGHGPTKRLPDLLGTVMLATGVGAVVVGITKGADWHWGSPQTLACIVGGGVLVLIALLRSSRHPSPAVETKLWRNRTFAAANLTSFIFGAAVYAWLLLSVLFVTLVWHYSILKAGLVVSPGAFTSVVAAIVGARLAEKYGQRPVVVFGTLVLMASGLWLRAEITATPDFVGLWLPIGLLAGVGMGAALTGLSSAAAMAVPPQQFAAATGLNMTARQVGGALGIAVLAAILESQITHGFSAFMDVYLFTAIVSGVAAVAALGLRPLSTPLGIGSTEAPEGDARLAAPATVAGSADA